MATVFLSYDHDDVERAAPIASALEKAGHSVWWDRHIQGGAQYNDEIEAAVEAANAVVVLWSERSVRSTWVRDEAAEGRDQNKLVPVLLDAVKPPMGFRQFQTIDLSRSSRGPSGSSLQQILDSIEKVRGAPRPSPPPLVAQPYKGFGPISRRTGAVAAVLALLGLAGFFAWTWRSEPALAVVAVTASDAQPRSQALSHDLVVKLGTLANIGSSKWQLADPQSARSDPDLVFRVAESESSGQSLATLVLLDGKRNSVLWSREFAQQKGTVADLRLQVTLTAGRALGCALDAREAVDLTPDLFKRFLVGCSEADEISNNEPDKTVAVMRAIIAERPSFAPAWAQLLIAQANVVGFATSVNGDAAGARQKLSQDIANARRIVPDLPEIRVAEADLLSPFDYAGALEKTAQ
ncbi:MAG TPA: toll/interleukin-1 receptor domain-containing protein, partial [Sphingomicrobium sp.]|nr:toll/interleukin-1 receptor domain-containing protein [Sphingomicrobium sp.]